VHNRSARLIATLATLLLVGSACSSKTTTNVQPSGTPQASGNPSSTAVDLASVCPNPIVIQTGWLPQPERAFMYELIGPNGTHDASAGKYSGPALADPRVTVELRSGGPAAGFQSGTSLIYADRKILLFDGDFDAMIADSKKFPVVGVMAPLEKNPQMLMYDPATYTFNSIDDVKASGATVLVEPNATYAKVFVGLGKLDAKQIDDSYDFSPSRFVAAHGKLVQQGFATSEPYLYEQTIKEWGKPVKYILNHDAGYPSYAVAVAARPDTVTSEADCLKVLVPLLQRGMVAYLNDPTSINDLLVKLSAEENSASPLTSGQAEYAFNTMKQDGIVSNGVTPTFGDYEMDRVQQVIDLVKPVFLAQHVNTFNPDLTADQMVTNQFIDPSISLG
jgi:hypothetical protein